MGGFSFPGSFFVMHTRVGSCSCPECPVSRPCPPPPHPLPQLLLFPFRSHWKSSHHLLLVSEYFHSVASQYLLTQRPPVPSSTLKPRKSRYSPAHNSPVGPTSPSLPIADHPASLLVSGPAPRLTLPGGPHTCCLLCLCAPCSSCMLLLPSPPFQLLMCRWLKALLANLGTVTPFPHCPVLSSQSIEILCR